MLARAMVSAFILTEVSFSLSFYFLTTVLVDKIGLVGVSISYAINYSLYWVMMALLIRKEMIKMEDKNFIS